MKKIFKSIIMALTLVAMMAVATPIKSYAANYVTNKKTTIEITNPREIKAGAYITMSVVRGGSGSMNMTVDPGKTGAFYTTVTLPNSTSSVELKVTYKNPNGGTVVSKNVLVNKSNVGKTIKMKTTTKENIWIEKNGAVKYGWVVTGLSY